MSTGIHYSPAKEAPTEEVIELAKSLHYLWRYPHHSHARRGVYILVLARSKETIEIGMGCGRARGDIASQGEWHAKPRPRGETHSS